MYINFTYNNGNRYSGGWNNSNIGFISDACNGTGEPTGTGTMKYTNGNKYNGNWKNGLFHGYGLMKYSNGYMYSGNWINGEKWGSGILTIVVDYEDPHYNDDDDDDESKTGTYTGEFKHNKMWGEGVFEYNNGDIFKGIMTNNMLGKGKLIYENGNIYEGEFKDNLPCGQGKLNVISHESEYIGEFYDGLPHGYGTITFKTSEIQIYRGRVDCGTMDGYGTLIYRSGLVYIGQMKADLENGRGKLIYEGGDVFDGYFIDGQPYGKGIMYYKLNNGTNECEEITIGFMGHDDWLSHDTTDLVQPFNADDELEKYTFDPCQSPEYDYNSDDEIMIG